jgi:hypothetical protein
MGYEYSMVQVCYALQNNMEPVRSEQVQGLNLLVLEAKVDHAGVKQNFVVSIQHSTSSGHKQLYRLHHKSPRFLISYIGSKGHTGSCTRAETLSVQVF